MGERRGLLRTSELSWSDISVSEVRSRGHRALIALLAALAVGVMLWFHLTRGQAPLLMSHWNGTVEDLNSDDRVLVIAPHPDDETVGCGGLIQQALAVGASVDIAIVTNGDASELSLIFAEKELRGTPARYISLGRDRQVESLRALALLGLDAPHVHFLGYPNNGLLQIWLPDHWSAGSPYPSPYTGVASSPYELTFTPRATYCGSRALDDLMTLMRRIAPTRVFVVHPQDIHPDHFAVSRLVTLALETSRARGEAWATETQERGYLVHWPRWPVPRTLAPLRPLLPPEALADQPWLGLELTPAQQRRKLQAIRLYHSQEPGFDRLLLAFDRINECFAAVGEPLLRPGTRLAWQDENSHRRALHGAEVTSVRVEMNREGTIRAAIGTSGRALARAASICLDLRGWDAQGEIVGITLRIGHDGKVSTLLLGGGPAPATPIAVRDGAGTWHVDDLPASPGADLTRGLLVTCWGSYRDRAVDPAPPP